MTPADFIKKWKDNPLSEKAGAQPHFLDLCELLGTAKPNDPDNYCFERGATRTGAGHGWADVWKRNCFAWENKGPHGDLQKALKQLMTYALALENPPLLVVCNRALIEIHTHFNGTPSEVYTIRLEDIGEPTNLQMLRWLFNDPEKFRPTRTLLDVTRDAAGRFASIAQSMQERGHPPERIAHFLIQCLFCMFAEDSGLLPEKLFQRIVSKSADTHEKLGTRLQELFKSMKSGGDFMLEDISWFNGGLFEIVEPIPVEAREAKALLEASNMNWSHIEPSIFGTMFERGLDPKLRSQLGANYTDPETIGKLIDPVVVRPLKTEWDAAKSRIAEAMVKYHAGGRGSQSAHTFAQKTFLGFIERLKNFRVLDPACGSGNFLYLALRALKDLEHRANLDAESLGLHRQLTIETSPANVLGIEINSYAAELARVTVWIGEIQWMLKHGYDIRRNPILSPLEHIECRDAVLNSDGTEADWPKVDAIVGNPPFLGDKKMRGGLGASYVDSLRKRFDHRVHGGSDLVTFWFEKARAQIERDDAKLVGLVATNSIRGGANRHVLDRIASTTRIFEAWSDEPWVNEGAAVRVSLVCFGNATGSRLNGRTVTEIFSDLNASARVAGEGTTPYQADVTLAHDLAENASTAFNGIQKTGAFDIPGTLAREWLMRGGNPNALPNSQVLSPYWNGLDLTRRPRDVWIIDFGWNMNEAACSQFEAPFSHVYRVVRPQRLTNKLEALRRDWWRLWRPRPEMRRQIAKLPRYIVTPEVSKHRIFSWLSLPTLPDKNLIVIARSDDVTFGILHSRFHELWALRLGTSLEDRPRYTPSTTFETFPFPRNLTPRDTASQAPSFPEAMAVERAGKDLNALRENWLNPAEWTGRQPEVVPGFPDRVLPKPGYENELKKRTLTNLYNVRPTWLDKAHKSLDVAVARAYGWTDYTPEMPDEEILHRLLELNQKRVSGR